MKNTRLTTGVFIAVVLMTLVQSFAQKNPTDIEYLKQNIKYSDYYNFIQYEKNMLEWNQLNAASPFFEKLKKVNQDRVVVLHIGDSHIQSDIGTGVTRAMMQQIFGYGGRGMVFPYQAAGTHSAYDYYAQVIGAWTSSKNVELKPKMNIGVSGITVFTNDTAAGFKLIFRKQYYSIQPDFRRIRLYCHKGPESFDAKIKAGNSNEWIKADCNTIDYLPYVEVILPKASDTLTVMVNKTAATQKYFECYGVEILGMQNSGIQYMSVGINGAGYHSFFNQNVMESQLKAIQPDLIIFDLGVNDFFRGAFNYQYIMSSLNKAIALFRSSCPNATIMLPNAQDIYYRGGNISNCKDYSMLTRLLSKEQNVVLYDYYNVSGGQFSMAKWSTNGLSQRDKCHLSYKGYKVKGELFCNAMLNSYVAYLSRRPDSLLVFNDKIDTTNFASWVINKSTYYNRQAVATTDKIDDYKTQPVIKTGTPATSGYGQYYIVRSGDNLGSIASKYGTTVSNLQQWNSLKSTRIYAGQKLLVSKTATKTTTQSTAATTIKTQPTTGTGNKIVYTIKSGDNLGSIATKYKVTVDEIKRWNGLSNSSIVAGKTLIIYTSVAGTKTNNAQTAGTTGSSTTKRGIVYVVKTGDSLWSIANKHKTTVERIKKDNKMTSDKLNIGQKLIIN